MQKHQNISLQPNVVSHPAHDCKYTHIVIHAAAHLLEATPPGATMPQLHPHAAAQYGSIRG